MRKSIPNKIKMLLQKEIFSQCPFCGNEDVDHFEIHHIDENPENSNINNLLMICPLCHSKITKGDILQKEVIEKKQFLQKEEKGASMAKIINFNSRINNSVIGDNNTINIVKKNNKTKYPEGCIGFDNNKANYISYLIDRYHKYKEWEIGKDNMNYAIFGSQLKKKFKIGQSRTIYNVPIEKFLELIQEIQRKINGTKLAKNNKSRGQLKNYESYEEYLNNQRTKAF